MQSLGSPHAVLRQVVARQLSGSCQVLVSQWSGIYQIVKSLKYLSFIVQLIEQKDFSVLFRVVMLLLPCD